MLKLKKIEYIAIIFLVLSIISAASYRLIGAEVLEDGTLQEPFFLIPLSYLFGAVFIVCAIQILISRFKAKSKR